MKIWEYDEKSLPQVLEGYRKLRRIPQLKLAVEADVSQSTIQLYETGKRVPSVDHLIKIARAMGVDEIRIFIPRE